MNSGAPSKPAVGQYYIEFSLAEIRCTSESSHLTADQVEALARELLAIGAVHIHIKRTQS
jgi:hypothetical protein